VSEVFTARAMVTRIRLDSQNDFAYRRPPKPANDHAQQPGPLGDLCVTKREHAAPVCYSGWFGVTVLSFR